MKKYDVHRYVERKQKQKRARSEDLSLRFLENQRIKMKKINRSQQKICVSISFVMKTPV